MSARTADERLALELALERGLDLFGGCGLVEVVALAEISSECDE